MSTSTGISPKKLTLFLSMIMIFSFIFTFTRCNIGSIDDDATNDNSAVYTAVTADNIELKLCRYRPSTDAKFNKKGQPVLLLPGVGMNMNEFLYHTTDLMKDEYAKMELPSPLPAWADGDQNIQKDHMLLYNLAYYLWLQGYDPWLGNYRGVGRDGYKSQAGIDKTNLDVLGCLDAPALVKKVADVTRKKPIIGGHSTGGVACYIYLQGAYMDTDEVIKGAKADPPYLPHVKMSTRLAAERNAGVRGFLGIDPAMIPPLPDWMDLEILWEIIRIPLYIPVDDLFTAILVDSGYTGTLMDDIVNTLIGTIDTWCADNNPDLEFIHFWQIDNMDPYVLDYFMRYATTSIYLRVFAQYYDWGMNLNMREGWTNGLENIDVVTAPEKTDGDGYYYYEDHMTNVTTPTACFLSYHDGLVKSETIINYLMKAKTPTDLDTWYVIPGTAHADLPCSKQAAAIMFPMIGEWLDKL